MNTVATVSYDKGCDYQNVRNSQNPVENAAPESHPSSFPFGGCLGWDSSIASPTRPSGGKAEEPAREVYGEASRNTGLSNYDSGSTPPARMIRMEPRW
jgi:hypothetical protein